MMGAVDCKAKCQAYIQEDIKVEIPALEKMYKGVDVRIKEWACMDEKKHVVHTQQWKK